MVCQNKHKNREVREVSKIPIATDLEVGSLESKPSGTLYLIRL